MVKGDASGDLGCDQGLAKCRFGVCGGDASGDLGCDQGLNRPWRVGPRGDSKPLLIETSWDGKWNGAREMANHLVVKEVSPGNNGRAK